MITTEQGVCVCVCVCVPHQVKQNQLNCYWQRGGEQISRFLKEANRHEQSSPHTPQTQFKHTLQSCEQD